MPKSRPTKFSLLNNPQNKSKNLTGQTTHTRLQESCPARAHPNREHEHNQ